MVSIIQIVLPLRRNWPLLLCSCSTFLLLISPPVTCLVSLSLYLFFFVVFPFCNKKKKNMGDIGIRGGGVALCPLHSQIRSCSGPEGGASPNPCRFSMLVLLAHLYRSAVVVGGHVVTDKAKWFSHCAHVCGLVTSLSFCGDMSRCLLGVVGVGCGSVSQGSRCGGGSGQVLGVCVGAWKRNRSGLLA